MQNGVQFYGMVDLEMQNWQSHGTGCKIARNTGTNVTKFFTLVTKS